MEAKEYTATINRFGRKLEKAVKTDFPGNDDLLGQIDSALIQIHFRICGAFVERNNNNKKG